MLLLVVRTSLLLFLLLQVLFGCLFPLFRVGRCWGGCARHEEEERGTGGARGDEGTGGKRREEELEKEDLEYICQE